MKHIGLFFGSYNPLHIGHLIIGSYFAEFTDLNEVWFVVTPQNPLKQKNAMLEDHQRLHLVRLATEDSINLKACDIEFHLPMPSYTINTLVNLEEKYSDKKFSLIMGADNYLSLNKWKNYQLIRQKYNLYVYPRKSFEDIQTDADKNVIFAPAPLIELSSSFIREAIKNKKNVRYMLPEKVYNYISEMHFYEK